MQQNSLMQIFKGELAPFSAKSSVLNSLASCPTLMPMLTQLTLHSALGRLPAG